jgi:hypothetical protein
VPEAPSASDVVAAPETGASVSTETTDAVSTSDSSSEATGAKAPSSVLDAVTAALKTDKVAEGSPASKTDKDGVSTDAAEAETALPDRPTPEEMNSLHSRTRRRVKQLLGKWDEAKAESDKLRPHAEQFRKIDDFVKSSGLTWDETNAGFAIMRALKNDPFEARERLQPIMEALDKACGVELPADLRQKVDQGFVDEATARDLAQSKARAHFATQAQSQTVERVQQAQQAEAHQRHVGSVTSAVKSFQENWRKSDPDYTVKSPLVMEKVELTLSRLARQGQTISDPAQAVKIVEDAKKAVEDTFKPFARREQINPLPNGSLSSSANVKPKTMAEAVAQGLAIRV